jgi:putative tricarboxylic transport membrane protein
MKKFGDWIKKQNAGLIMGIIFTIYTIYYFIMSFRYPYENQFGVGPGFFPRWVALLAIIAGVSYCLMSIFKDKFIVGEILPNGKELINVGTVVLAILGFILIVNFTGFCIASTLLLFFIFIRSFTWWKALLYAVIATALVFLIFKVGFSVPLPVNALGI